MITIYFSGLICLYSSSLDGKQFSDALIVPDVDHQRRVFVDDHRNPVSASDFQTLAFDHYSYATADHDFQTFAAHLKMLAATTPNLDIDPGAAIRLPLPEGTLTAHFRISSAKFTLPNKMVKNQNILYMSRIDNSSAKAITVDNTTYPITNFVVILNSSDKMKNSYQPGHACYNHFARYGRILTSHDCADMATADDLSDTDPGMLTIQSFMGIRSSRFTIFNALQTQCSNSQWP
ncbi:MAG TPA: hypothetical protein VF443_05130 [Nitrospira sp.]